MVTHSLIAFLSFISGIMHASDHEKRELEKMRARHEIHNALIATSRIIKEIAGCTLRDMIKRAEQELSEVRGEAEKAEKGIIIARLRGYLKKSQE